MIGKKLSAYEITEEIGSGGMATVFRARQSSMDRHAAIKVIRSTVLQDQGLRERFQREARFKGVEFGVYRPALLKEKEA